MGKCDNCEIKKWYERIVDYHIFDERDCPYECKKKKNQRRPTKSKMEG